MHDTTAEPVYWPDLARELRLTRQQRREILRARLVTPAGGEIRQGTPTLITPESADLLIQARRVLDWIQENPGPALAVGVTFIVVLRLLAAGAVEPNIP